nr:hypothetical protein [Thiohalocapsa sp. ML1]
MVDQAPVLEDQDGVAEVEGLLVVVGGDQGGDALRPQAPVQAAEQAPAQHRVDVAEGLVHEEHPRAYRERPGQGHPLLLAAGEPVDAPVPQVGDLKEFQELLHQGPRRSGAAQAERQVLLDVQVGEEGELLEHEGDLPLLRRDVQPAP